MQNENIKQDLESSDDSLRSQNGEWIRYDDDCKKSIDELKQLEKFIGDMGFLFSDRDFIATSKAILILQPILTSVELTMGSIISCCENGCIADANSLLRKYRDDIFFYLYVLVYDSNLKLEQTPPGNKKMEETISSWMKNNLKNFRISQLLKSIATSDDLQNAIDEYNLRQSFDEIGKQLNNYVHSNGYIYYNKTVNGYKSGELAIEISKIVRHAKYITIVFLFLLTLCAPHMIMSTDYIDCLDCNETPPEGSQYWVAPFILQFIEENITLIDENCIEYFKNNTVMQFDM